MANQSPVSGPSAPVGGDYDVAVVGAGIVGLGLAAAASSGGSGSSS